MRKTVTNGYNAYGASAQRGSGAYQASGGNTQMMQTVRMLDSVLEQIERAHVCDCAQQIEAEYRAVELASVVLQGLASMIDRRQGRVAENLEKTYRSLMKALLGVCSMVGSRGQYLRLYDAALELRNAWASISGLPMQAMPPVIAEALAKEALAAGSAVASTAQDELPDAVVGL